MINDNLIKHSILLDLSLSLSGSDNKEENIKNVLLKIVKVLNCSSGIIYITHQVSEQNLIFQRHTFIPKNIEPLENSFKKIININKEHSYKDFALLLETLPLVIDNGKGDYFHFLPLKGLGILVLEKKDKSIDQTFLKMLNPILTRISDVIISNYQNINLKSFRNLFEQIDEYVVMYDRKRDQILDGNISFWNLIGRSDNPPINESIKKYLEINDSSDLDQEIDYILAAQNIVHNTKYNGKVIAQGVEISVSVQIFSKSEDNSDKIAFILKDLSLDQELEKQKNISEESQRLAGLGEMAGNIAHEINNPLAIITGSSKLLEMLVANQEIENKSNYLDNIKNIVSATERITTIITSLKKVSRDGALEEKKMNLVEDIIHDALDLSNHRIKVNSIKLDYEKLGLSVNCTLTQISQIIVNLLNNSIYAINDLEEKWIRISEVNFENHIQIKITDSGTDIPKDIQEKMMDKYYTSKPAGEGTGIGLSLSKEIMKKHEGKLFYDKDEVNTTFILEFPKIEN